MNPSSVFLTTNAHILNGEIIDWSKFKEYAGDKINATKNMNFVLERVENIVGKEENAGYKHFLLFPTMFSKGLLFRVVKNCDSVVKSWIV